MKKFAVIGYTWLFVYQRAFTYEKGMHVLLCVLHMPSRKVDLLCVRQCERKYFVETKCCFSYVQGQGPSEIPFIFIFVPLHETNECSSCLCHVYKYQAQ